MTIILTRLLTPLLALTLVACQHQPFAQDSSERQDVTEGEKASHASIENEFWLRLSTNCNKVFVGQSTYPDTVDDAFYGKTLKATVASCSASEIRVPFAVGEDRSRTWIFTRTERGVQLKHQHLHADGTPDEVTNYGGLAKQGDGDFIHASPDNDLSQISLSFPADEYTKSLIPAAATNVWTLTLLTNSEQNSEQNYAGLSYYLTRHDKPRFKAMLTRIEN